MNAVRGLCAAIRRSDSEAFEKYADKVPNPGRNDWIQQRFSPFFQCLRNFR